MEKTVRVCDECGVPINRDDECGVYRVGEAGPRRALRCAVCGKEYCGSCIGGWLKDRDAAVEADYLCPTHYEQVKEFIEGLKPKGSMYQVRHEGHFYFFEPRNKCWPSRQLIDEAADALYDHMAKERGAR